jgi:hypothetical protein
MHITSNAITTPGQKPQVCWSDLIDRSCPYDLARAIFEIGPANNIDYTQQMAFFRSKWSPVGYAIKRRRHKCLKVLLELGADPNCVCRVMRTYGKTGHIRLPLVYALYKENAIAVGLLLEHGAEIPSEIWLNPCCKGIEGVLFSGDVRYSMIRVNLWSARQIV